MIDSTCAPDQMQGRATGRFNGGQQERVSAKSNRRRGRHPIVTSYGGPRAKWGASLRRAARSASTPPPVYNFARRSSCALIATITVLRDISTAPIAGDSTIPRPARTPAASGMATTLYPAAHQRFCTIFR